MKRLIIILTLLPAAMICAAQKINRAEYFIDTDPGFGKGTVYSLPSPGGKPVVEFTANLTGVTSGDHILYFRARDASGRYSHLYAHAVKVTLSDIGDTEAQSWFRMYPSPSTGTLMIDLSDLQGSSVKFTISDLNGRTVYSGELEGGSTTLSLDLPAGIYMVAVESDDKVFEQ
ncbi:MAG: T9SS type A sorting domain-containing protein [Bacteroidales bacterium]|nr:T9SS type A sorting domain-containing protein [Bacteroidales bacterium]